MKARRISCPRPAVVALLLAFVLGLLNPAPSDAERLWFDANAKSATGASVEYAVGGAALQTPDDLFGSSRVLDAVAAAPTATPAWLDPLDGRADSGIPNVSGPNASGKPAANGVAWVAGASGQAASLSSDASYIGYSGARLKPDQGTILVRHKPIPDLVGVYAKRHDGWTNYGQYKPPQSGFLIDTIGWNAAPKGSYAATLVPGAKSTLSWGVWDGSKWHYATWTSPEGFGWDANRWYELGFTWGPKGMTILLDGEQKAAIPDVVQINNTIPWFLGQGPWSWPYGPHSLLGAYDDLRVYSEQLGPYAPVSSAAASVPVAGATPAAAPTASAIPGAAAVVSATSAPAAPPSVATSVPPGAPSRAPELAAKAPTALGGIPTPTAALAGLATPSPSPDPTAGGSAGALGVNGGFLPSLAAKLPGGPTGPIASTARQIDSLDLAGSLPGGAAGPVATTVGKMPGGTPLFCGWPLLLAAALVVLLVGFLAGRAGRRRPAPAVAAAGLASAADLSYAVPPPAMPPPPAAPGLPVTSGAAAGTAVPARFCDNCGEPLEENSRFCGKCGTRME
jgi:hypothetical protein